jgi:hypothetical protein
MKRFLMFMLLIFGVLFTANAVTEKPPVKDVGFECSINLDAQNYDVVPMMQQTQITLYKLTDVNLQSEGLQNLKYPSMNSIYIISSIHIENITIAHDFTVLKVLKYPLLC